MSAVPVEEDAGPAMRRSGCGGCVVALNGAEVTARASGALWLAGEGLLAAGDLHFEKGSAYGLRGQLLPPYDTHATLGRLEAEVSATGARTVVLMGDSFHDAGGEARLAPDVVARISALARGRTLVWIAGNHDEEAPRALPGEAADEVRVGPLVLTHEPAETPVAGEIAGHLHPVATIARYGQRVRRRCFLTDGERMILPAFGAYAGGLNAADRAFAGLFRRPPTALLLGDGRVHAVSWARLTPGR